jgi:hypothetical protein
MRRSTWLVAILCCVQLPPLGAQVICRRSSVVCSEDGELTTENQRASLQRALVHHGKWLTALGSAALIVFAQREHNRSNRDWNTLLDICRSAQDACARGADGRYLRSDAEQLYQRSRAFDRRANRWLLGAQAGLLTTTALFIIDLHPGDGPDNIPYPPVRVGMRVPF